MWRSLVLLILVGSQLSADTARDAALRQDLNTLARQIVQTHPNPFTRVTAEAFSQQVRALDDAIPALPDALVFARMTAIAAYIQDSHTGIDPDNSLLQRMGASFFPLRATLYDDGFFVSRATNDYARYLGWRVVTVNGKTPVELIEALSPFISHDNVPTLLNAFASYVSNAQFLQAAGVASEADRSAWVVESRDGRRETLNLTSSAVPNYSAQVNDPSVGYLSPTYLDPALFYWYRYYPEQKLLFFKYNSCAQRPDLPFAAFAADLFQTLDSQPVDTLVVDFRDNGGGNSSVWDPFVSGLQSRYEGLRLNPRFRFYGLISRFTASSAMLNIQLYKLFEGSLLIGEDTGGNPEAFGEIARFAMPNSKVNFTVSTRFIGPVQPGFTTPAVHPDVRAYRDSSDVFARFDPILFKIFALSDPLAPIGEENRTRPLVSSASLRLGSAQAAGSLSTIFGDFAAADGLTVAGHLATILTATSTQLDFLQPVELELGEQDVAVTRNGEVIWTGTETVAAARRRQCSEGVRRTSARRVRFSIKTDRPTREERRPGEEK